MPTHTLLQPRAHLQQPLLHARLGGREAAIHRDGDLLKLQSAKKPQTQGVGLDLRQAGEQDVQVAAAFASQQGVDGGFVTAARRPAGDALSLSMAVLSSGPAA